MKVLDLRCAHDHRFEGWFGSADDYATQRERGLVSCPLCGDVAIERLPSAPHLNVAHLRAPAGVGASAATDLPRGAAEASASSAVPVASSGSISREPPAQADSPVSSSGPQVPAALQAQWMAAMREVLARTEDVGPRFSDEARRIHYGESEARQIRGQATPAQRAELAEEGIEVHTLALPDMLKQTLQ